MKLSEVIGQMRNRLRELEDDLNLRLSYGGPVPDQTGTECVKQEIRWIKRWMQPIGDITEL